MQTLQEVEHYLTSLTPRSVSFGNRLAHVKSILHRLGSPQNAIPTIHLAGTSGKGSTAYYASAMLSEAGYSVGLAVSPHVSKVSERSQVNGATLPDDEYCRYVTEFKGIIEALGEAVTYIEFLTCFSFWLFAKLKLDYNVIEVGLGGRLDPTNTIARKDTVRVITDIGLDHTDILGDTLDAIAAEKAGIIHDGDTVCMHLQGALVMKSIKSAIDIHHARLVLVGMDGHTTVEPRGYQYRNWLLAKQAVKERLELDGGNFSDEYAWPRAARTSIPGRFEILSDGQETIILDVAHNPQKMEAFIKTLTEKYPKRNIVAVVSLGKNKQSSAKETLSLLANVADKIVFTEFFIDADESHAAIRALDIQRLTGSTDGLIDTSPNNALVQARSIAKKVDGIVVVTGSFYLVSNIRDELIREFERTK